MTRKKTVVPPKAAPKKLTEEQIEREVKRMAQAYHTHERAERRLVAAMNRWQRSRATLKRYDRKADKTIGGKFDVRDLA